MSLNLRNLKSRTGIGLSLLFVLLLAGALLTSAKALHRQPAVVLPSIADESIPEDVPDSVPADIEAAPMVAYTPAPSIPVAAPPPPLAPSQPAAPAPKKAAKAAKKPGAPNSASAANAAKKPKKPKAAPGQNSAAS